MTRLLYAGLAILSAAVLASSATWTSHDTSNSHLPNNNVFATGIDSTGAKWFGTSAGLARFDGSTWEAFTAVNSELPSSSIYAIAVDSANAVWVGTLAGLVEYDGAGWTVYDTANSGMEDNNAWAVVLDTDGSKWIGTWSRGVVYRGAEPVNVSRTMGLAPARPVLRAVGHPASGPVRVHIAGPGIAAFTLHGRRIPPDRDRNGRRFSKDVRLIR